MICGGFSSTAFADLPEPVQKAFQEHSKEFGQVQIVEIKQQVVAGINYKFIIQAGDKKGVMTLWAKLDRTVQCTSIDWE
ncbi:Cystatin domain-containing protein [Spironucleus salmonicida]|uniref:Cystatin domain protein n=1 Tax=Spironucleus salmonicida TaxID=348837 RepID=V6LVS7_9EUKA|nr:Cystatin domain-containing protein [Spironucleus salmonicida]|eukprot:EST48732.1 Cystatin domain protein [Spironucleus salmonicida]